MFVDKKAPAHVAIIMDGNGRWAKARGYPRFYGHIRGAARVREIVKECKRQGIKALTLYAFSTENWNRPQEELDVLWRLLIKYVRKEVKELNANGVRLSVLGEFERLPEKVKIELNDAIKLLDHNSGLQLNFALSYGGRAEIVQAAQKLVEEGLQKGSSKDQLVSLFTEQNFERHLWTSSLGKHSNVDLMIRTSGEVRLSNFLLWQCAYAEFDFPTVLWPDFTVDEFRLSLERYANRERRYGKV